MDDALAALERVKQDVHDRFPDHRARLEQLDAHLATAAMVIGHIADEDVRHNHNPVAHSKAIGEYVRED